MLRRSLAALAAGATLVVPVTGAVADPRPPHTTTTINVRTLYTGVLVNGLQVSATCEAEVTGLVAATVIDECYITSNGTQHPEALPHNAVASTFVERVTTLDFQVCAHAYTIPLDDPTPLAVTACTDGLLPSGLGGLGTGSATR